MEAIRPSETPVRTRVTRRNIPEDGILHHQHLITDDRFLLCTSLYVFIKTSNHEKKFTCSTLMGLQNEMRELNLWQLLYENFPVPFFFAF
jgi:hypothetical protein